MVKQTFGFAHPEDSPGFLLWQVSMIWQRQIKQALAPYAISHAQFVIMAVTLWYEEQGQTPIQSMIVDRTKLDKMTVSQAIKKLVSQGLVARKEHGEDTRAKSVSLTSKGKKQVGTLVAVIEAIDAKFFGVIDKSAHQALMGSISLMILDNNQ